MTDVSREKYRVLMGEVADLEERVEDMEQESAVAAESPNPADAEVVRQELSDLREQLAEKRSELARLSDGCGRPHPHS